MPPVVEVQRGRTCLVHAVANALGLNRTDVKLSSGKDLSNGGEFIINHFGGESNCHSVSCNGWPETLEYFAENKRNIVAGIARTRVETVKTRNSQVKKGFNHFVALRAHPDTGELYVLDSFDGTVQQVSERNGPCVTYFFKTGPGSPPEIIDISD